MSNFIFVAATSGSVLSINSVVDKPSHVLMFYPLTDYKKDPNLCMFAKHVETVINQFHSMDKMEHIHIIRSLNEMLCMITELQGKRADSYGKPIQIFTKECRNFDNK